VSRQAPLARTPFPWVPQTRKQARALGDAIRWLTLRDHPPEVGAPGQRRVSAKAQRDILDTIGRHTDGAGRAILSIGGLRKTKGDLRQARVAGISEKSGHPRTVVFRALKALEAQGHLERVPMLRTADRYPDFLPHQARHGQAPNVYRVGQALRAAACLVELDWAPDPCAVTPPAGPTLTEARGTPSADAVAPPRRKPARDTPQVEAVAPPALQGKARSATSTRDTPRTKNVDAEEKQRLVPSGSEGTSRTREPTLDEALHDPDLFARFVAPYAELVEDAT